MTRGKSRERTLKTLRTIGTILVLGAAAAYFIWQYSSGAPDQEGQVTEQPQITDGYATFEQVSPSSTPYHILDYTSIPSNTAIPKPSLEATLPGLESTPETTIEATFEGGSREALKLGSFNIQVFGESKANKPEVMDALGKIVSQYDIVAIQEIRDSSSEDEIGACSGIALSTLLERIRQETGMGYGCIQGDRQGRTSSKEQYVFVFNPDVVQPVGVFGGAFTYKDTNDVFEREPLVAEFRAGDFDFALVNIHTKPDDARAEICALSKVIEDAQTRYPNDDDVIVLGDYNADGSYFNENTTECLRAGAYDWLIGNTLDTTVAASDNTYDRIVQKHESGDEDFTGQAGVFYYSLGQAGTPFAKVELASGLELKAVSDHYPVWALFYMDKDTD